MKKHPVSDLARFFFALGLLFALGPQVQAQTVINWTKYDNTIPPNSDTTSTNGRIPRGNNTRGDDDGAFFPIAIKDGAIYKMWYTGTDGANYRVYHATSSNGLDWAKSNNSVPPNSDTTSTSGRIPLGGGGRGDSIHIYSAFVIKDDSTYKMWYSGSDGTNIRIYYATSSNSLDWVKYSNSVPTNSDTTSTSGRIPLGNAGRGDDAGAHTPSVIKDGSTYRMWYTGYDGGTTRIYYATSSNGLDWAKLDNGIPENSDGASTNGKIPLGSSGKGDSLAVQNPSVIRDGSTYKMWYLGTEQVNTGRVYHATSPDGLTWTKFNNTIPPVSDTTNSNSRIGLGTAGKGDDKLISAPKVVVFDDEGGRYYKLWYAGFNAGNYFCIYHATGPTIPRGTIFTFK